MANDHHGVLRIEKSSASRSPTIAKAEVRQVTRAGHGHRAASRRFRYRRRHTPHFYLVISALCGATLVCACNVAGYVTRSVPFAQVTFFLEASTALLVSVSFFWGFFMLMSGNLPAHRVKVFFPHAAVGVLSPLLYMLNVSLALDSYGRRPIQGGWVIFSFLCLGLLTIQFTMGRAVVRPEPLHIVPRASE